MEERLRDGTRSGLRAAGLTAGRGRTTKARCVCRLALTIVGLARDRCELSIHMGTKTTGNSAGKRPVPLASATRALAHSCGAISLANGRDEHRGISPNAVAAEGAKRALSAIRLHPQVAQRRGPVRRPQAMPHQSWAYHLLRGWHPPRPCAAGAWNRPGGVHSPPLLTGVREQESDIESEDYSRRRRTASVRPPAF